LERLERLNPGEGRRPRSPKDVYDRIREDARESIAQSLADGEEPLYAIAENGDVLFADGRPVDHLGDFIRALDERIAALNAEIAEAEADMTPEELAWERAELEESRTRRAGLSLDEKIATLRAEIAAEEGNGNVLK
jgi:uncharacterized small protein (DUF1192 family)